MHLRFLLFISLLASTLTAAEPVSKSLFTSVAIGGKDTVAYHLKKNGAAVKGDKDYIVEWNGAKWRFANLVSKEKFAANPEKYVPMFNGHCANALSIGEGLVKTDGSVWQFFEDQLFLFYAQKGLARWQAGDAQQYLLDAERAWSVLTSE